MSNAISNTAISHLIGVGTDIVSISRISTLINSNKRVKFLSRILTAKEFELFNNFTEEKAICYFAKRFAAKEAVAKSLGMGIGIIAFNEIEICNNDLGQPYVKFLKELPILENIKISLSITDDSNFAAATAIAFKN